MNKSAANKVYNVTYLTMALTGLIVFISYLSTGTIVKEIQPFLSFTGVIIGFTFGMTLLSLVVPFTDEKKDELLGVDEDELICDEEDEPRNPNLRYLTDEEVNRFSAYMDREDGEVTAEEHDEFLFFSNKLLAGSIESLKEEKENNKDLSEADIARADKLIKKAEYNFIDNMLAYSSAVVGQRLTIFLCNTVAKSSLSRKDKLEFIELAAKESSIFIMDTRNMVEVDLEGKEASMLAIPYINAIRESSIDIASEEDAERLDTLTERFINNIKNRN